MAPLARHGEAFCIDSPNEISRLFVEEMKSEVRSDEPLSCFKVDVVGVSQIGE